MATQDYFPEDHHSYLRSGDDLRRACDWSPRVGWFRTCMMPGFFPAADRAAVHLLREVGATVVIPSLDIERDLPLGEAVEISLPEQSAGTVDFACAMDMMHGSLVVR